MGYLHQRHRHSYLLYSMLYCLLFLLVSCTSASLTERHKRSATAPSLGSDYPDYQSGVRYDEYPVVVPKRTAMLLDRIMVALQKAVDDEKSGRTYPSELAEAKMDLQRRGQQKGRVYWRCYFNAVTCFKRK